MPRILVVEDDEDLRALTTLALEQLGGWEVLGAGCGETALEQAARQPLDLILLDVRLPGISGQETLSRLRADDALARVPVVLVSALTHAEDADRLRALGADGVIAKPYDPLALPAELDRYLVTHDR